MDFAYHFQSLLEAASLTDPDALSAALDIPIETAKAYADSHVNPPRVVVLAVERLIDLRLADEISGRLPGRCG